MILTIFAINSKKKGKSMQILQMIKKDNLKLGFQNSRIWSFELNKSKVTTSLVILSMTGNLLTKR
jgi:hypothetical protein